MDDYQNENKPDKMLLMGRKVLTLDPNNSIALAFTAMVLADSLSDTDNDRNRKIDEIKTNANRLLQTVNTSFTAPPSATPEQVMAYKSTLRSMAHSSLGIMELKTNDDVKAEADLKLAAALNKTAPDPYVWYHLALAEDHQRKYTEALASVEQALKSTASNPQLDRLVKDERARLIKLVNGP